MRRRRPHAPIEHRAGPADVSREEAQANLLIILEIQGSFIPRRATGFRVRLRLCHMRDTSRRCNRRITQRRCRRQRLASGM